MRSTSLGCALLVLVLSAGCGGEDGSSFARNDWPRVARQVLLDASGGVISSFRIDYDASGLPLGVRTYDGGGVLVSTTTYEYADGRRTLSTTYSGNDAVTGTSARLYSEGRLSEVHLLAGSVATTRTFQYEAGPNVIDNEQFFEF